MSSSNAGMKSPNLLAWGLAPTTQALKRLDFGAHARKVMGYGGFSRFTSVNVRAKSCERTLHAYRYRLMAGQRQQRHFHVKGLVCGCMLPRRVGHPAH